MPDVYEASARIYVDTQSVLKPLMQGLAVQPNVDQQVMILSRTLISRPNVEKLVRMADLDLSLKSKTEHDATIDGLMRSLRIESLGRDNLYTLAYRDTQLSRPLKGSGFVVESPQQLRACTYASFKFPGRAPQGHALLRAYLPPQDGDPAQIAHAQLASILGIRGEPLWSRTYHWDRGLPRYRAQHAEQVADVRKRLRRLPPIAIAGAGYDGAGVSACVRSGREAARQLLRN
jgi:hypothetical protein